MNRYVLYFASFVAYLFVLVILTILVKPFLGLLLWLLAGLVTYELANRYRKDFPWIEQVLNDIENFDIENIRTRNLNSTEDDDNEIKKSPTDAVVQKAKESVNNYSKKIDEGVSDYTERFDKWQSEKGNMRLPDFAIGEKIRNFSFNSEGLYKFRLWSFLIFVPLIIWIVMWDIISWPFLIWFSWWFSYNDAYHLGSICSLILSYFLIIRIYSHCTNNRNLPINSEMMGDFDNHVVIHLFRLPTDYNSIKLTVKALLLDFIGGYLLIIFTSLYAIMAFDKITRASFDEFVAEGYFSLVVSMLSIAVFVPIMEELMFRGFVLDLASEVYGRWPAIIISASLFALIHPLYPLTLLNAFWAGLIYGYLRIRTNSLWPSIMLHSFWNAHIILLQFYL